MKITAEPRSDQWNAEDFLGGNRVFTIAGVRTGNAEQKYDIDLVEGEGRAWRPPLTMLRILIAAWGDDGTTWPGRKVELYYDPDITFGPSKVGGIRIAAVSGIDKPLTLRLTTTRGKRAPFTVKPLSDAPDPLAPHVAALNAATTLPELQAAWEDAGRARVTGAPQIIALKEARKAAVAVSNGVPQ